MDLRVEQPNFSDTDAVFHLAARVTGIRHDDEASTLIDNLRMDFNVVEACIKGNVRKLVYASSCAAEIGKDSGYGWGKLTTEKLLAQTTIQSVILRFFNVYGPGESFTGSTHVIPELLRKVLWEEHVSVYGDGSQTRPFLYVDDAVDAYMRALTAQSDGMPIDIGGAEQVSVGRLLHVIMKVTGRSPSLSFDESAPVGPKKIIPDLRRAEEILGWTQKTSIEEGIRKTAEWMRTVHTPSVQ